MPQLDGMWSLAQALDLMMPNVVTCAFYDIRVSFEFAPAEVQLPIDRLIACQSTTREQLDCFAWRVVAREQPLQLEREYWANEQYQGSGWVGAKIRDAAIIEDFLNAYYGLGAWDAWYDPEYFDKMLISRDKRPNKLLFKKDLEG